MACLLIGSTALVSGQIDPNSPTTQWVPIFYASSIPDAAGDQQTGTSESDIVGDATHPSCFKKFVEAETPSATNGWLGFRLRLAGDPNPPGFKSVAMVGLDANLDNRLDLFLGVGNQGVSSSLAIWSPGPGENTSPKTTSILTPALSSYAETAANYSFEAVTAARDPSATSFDLDAGGKTDYFLTFVFDFSEVVWALNSQGIAGVTKDTPLRFLLATASQQNSLNQDLNGVTGGLNSSLTWEELGGLTMPYSVTSLQPVPEPKTWSMVLLGFLFLMSRRASSSSTRFE